MLASVFLRRLALEANVQDMIGRRIGPYEIRDQIGQGGMATVYRAYQPSLNRYVAIKFLSAAIAHDAEFIARFRHEALAAGGLDHPNILRIFDADTVDGRPYIVMALAPGGALSERLRGGALPFDEAAETAAQIASALNYAHRRGIVHRDLKPSNVLLDEEGRPLLADFGIAKAITEGQSEGPRLTRTGVSIGTPEYMSPEQAEGLPIDGRSDLFSLGIVLYQLVTGQAPFQGDTSIATMFKIVHQRPQPVREIKPQTPDYLVSIIDKALAKRPAERFQSGQEMAQALRERRVVAAPDAGDRDAVTEALPAGRAARSGRGKPAGQPLAAQQGRRAPSGAVTSSRSFWLGLAARARRGVGGRRLSGLEEPDRRTAGRQRSADHRGGGRTTDRRHGGNAPRRRRGRDLYRRPRQWEPTCGWEPTRRWGDRGDACADARCRSNADPHADASEADGQSHARPHRLTVRHRGHGAGQPNPDPDGDAVTDRDADPAAHRNSTRAPTVTATILPTAAPCARPPAAPFGALWQQYRAELGCATTLLITSDAASERFQRGRMIWRKDNDQIYVLFDDGDWLATPDTSVDGAPEPAGAAPPAGLYAPVRGFGATWRERLGGSGGRIGWATEAEYGVSMQFQDFDRGLMLVLSNRVYLLGDSGRRWRSP